MEYLEQLNNVCLLTTKMLDLAKKGDWDEVMKLDQLRQPKLAAMARCTPIKSDEHLVDKLNNLVQLNNQLEKITTVEKNNCHRNYYQNKNNKKAFRAYSNA